MVANIAIDPLLDTAWERAASLTRVRKSNHLELILLRRAIR